MVVLDSSTLILLAKAGLLDVVLQQSKERMLIPPAVFAECMVKKGSTDAQLIRQRVEEKKIIIESGRQPDMVSRLQTDFSLGRGEAEALALCMEKKMVLLTDDKKAIQACRVFHIVFVTALNMIVGLRKKSHLTKDQALQAFKKLQFYGRYSKELINKVEGDLP